MPKRILHLVSLLLGFIGVIGCVAAIVGIWVVGTRVEHATVNVFEVVDGSLAGVQRRVSKLQDQLRASRITTNDIEQRVREWALVEARERLAARLEVEEKAKHLEDGLQQAGHWLELTESSIQLVQQALDVGSALGVPVQADSTDGLLKEIAALQVQLTAAVETVNHIEERAAGESGEEEDHQIVHLALRVVATFSTIDTRLEAFGDQRAQLQAKTRSARAASLLWIRIIAICLTLLSSWMAAGQCSLAYLGWRGVRPADRFDYQENRSRI